MASPKLSFSWVYSPLTDRWGAGVQDLGDLVLPPAPVLVGGTVVDPDGRPLEGVTVGVARSTTEEAFPHGALSDSEGRITVRSATQHERVRLVLRKPAFEKVQMRPIKAGTEAATVVLSPEVPEDER